MQYQLTNTFHPATSYYIPLARMYHKATHSCKGVQTVFAWHETWVLILLLRKKEEEMDISCAATYLLLQFSLLHEEKMVFRKEKKDKQHKEENAGYKK